MQEELAVAIREAAIDRVAAHHSDDVRVLLRLVFPENLAVVVEVQCKDGVREWRVNIHYVANNQRRALVSPQNASGEGPDRRELVSVVRVDLLQFRIASIRVIARR